LRVGPPVRGARCRAAAAGGLARLQPRARERLRRVVSSPRLPVHVAQALTLRVFDDHGSPRKRAIRRIAVHGLGPHRTGTVIEELRGRCGPLLLSNRWHVPCVRRCRSTGRGSIPGKESTMATRPLQRLRPPGNNRGARPDWRARRSLRSTSRSQHLAR
jgi:hypothetical protein